MWNDGHIHVYVKGECVESIFVDDFIEENQDVENDEFWCADDIIDMLKEKYGIKKVERKEHNWR